MKLRLIRILSVIFTFFLLSVSKTICAGYGQGEEYQDERIGMADPAALYCIEMGYEYKVVNEPSGQRGICLFPDGSECDAWAFLQGKCAQNYSYCAKCGYDIKTLTDGKNPFSREYAVCISKEGKHIGSVTELMNLSERTTTGSGRSGSEENRWAGKQLSSNVEAPPSFDWRDHNGHDWMTPVKDQGNCGACWAFAAVGLVEAWHNIWRNDPNLDLDLSEQYLTSDCYAGGDCNGGMDVPAIIFACSRGIPDENCFPYVASDAPCSSRCSDWQNRLVRMDSTKYLWYGPQTSSNEIKEFIASKGPMEAAMLMGGYWDGDIYRCAENSPGHDIVIAGYSDPGGYWIVKNSWGTGFGENGYFKVGYGECAIGPTGNQLLKYTDEAEPGCLITRNTILHHDILNCRNIGLWMTDSVILDCNGHMIEGSEDSVPPLGCGIDLFMVTGASVKNCIVTNFYMGIDVERSHGNNFFDNRLIGNTGYGIILFAEGSQNAFWGNVLANNGVNAYEDFWLNPGSNSWSLADIGNQWSDFNTNPGYPDSYVVAGSGDGVDHHATQYGDVGENPNDNESSIPKEAALGQNYPNPFNPTTSIHYTLSKHTCVRIVIYDILGRKVRTLLDQYQSAGYNSIIWDGKNDVGKDVASGIYFYQLRIGDFSESKKMLLLK